MPRLSYFGALLAIASLSSASIAAQTAPPARATAGAATTATTPASSSARVQHVLVRGTGTAMEVEIQTSGAPVEPNTQVITGPDRIVIDFPGALPSAELRAVKVNRGPLKSVRSGLFFSNPPITRVVLDLAEPQSYQIASTKISTTGNAVIVKLAPAQSDPDAGSQASTPASSPARLQSATLSTARPASIRSTSQSVSTRNVVPARISSAVSGTASNSTTVLPGAASDVVANDAPGKPAVAVTFENGMLSIRADRATLAQVLFEVHRQTHAEIAIPSGAEQEEVFADLGPAPARDVLGSLLNGSPYNFIFVGTESTLQQVLLTRRDPNNF